MKRETWIALGATVLALLLTYVFFAYMPLSRKLHRERALLTVKERTLAEVKQTVARFEEYQDRAARTQMAVQRLEERIPARKQVPELIRDITRAATECNLKDFQFTPQPLAPSGDVWEQPVKISAVCSYHALGAFLYKVACQPRLVTARDLKLTGNDKTGKSESILAEFTLVTYVSRNK
ncbi:MAG: type 4a pilus biogenesis protein PilO [Candidatus Firestonebacteria bacterium]|nr:type 4a pilus biogenesis protein PilO [Candidatus Firestonebacteria bacterium]